MAKSRNPSLGQVSDFDIRLLRIFKTIVECGSFSAAESTRPQPLGDQPAHG